MSAAAKNLKGYSTRVDAQLFADLAQLRRESDKRERVLQRAEGHVEGRAEGLKVAAAKLLAAGMGRDEVERILDVKLDSLGV